MWYPLWLTPKWKKGFIIFGVICWLFVYLKHLWKKLQKSLLLGSKINHHLFFVNKKKWELAGFEDNWHLLTPKLLWTTMLRMRVHLELSNHRRKCSWQFKWILSKFQLLCIWRESWINMKWRTKGCQASKSQSVCHTIFWWKYCWKGIGVSTCW